MTPASYPDMMLRIEDMGVTYPGNVLALRPTTVDFNKGEFTVLLGLSGAILNLPFTALNALDLPTKPWPGLTSCLEASNNELASRAHLHNSPQ